MGVSVKALKEKAEQLHEVNPMLGHRGCRLGITFPAIYEMQAGRSSRRRPRRQKKGIKVRPEVMIPLIGTVEEYIALRDSGPRGGRRGARRQRKKLRYQVGTMMEIPRACLTPARVAAEAEFFSFGTNDLTQMTYGYSRDDVGKFLPEYVDRRILPVDPFQTVDTNGCRPPGRSSPFGKGDPPGRT